PARTDIFAVQNRNGHEIASSDPELTARIRSVPVEAASRPFGLEGFGPAARDYDGLVLKVDSRAGPLTVAVARASDADALAHGLMREFVLDISWAIPLFAAATLAVAVWSVRDGLKPVRLASASAATIAPGSTDVRLPTDALPSELVPLAAAVN